MACTLRLPGYPLPTAPRKKTPVKAWYRRRPV
jgi:hypothetical protein